jgi:hypothetical protein
MNYQNKILSEILNTIVILISNKNIIANLELWIKINKIKKIKKEKENSVLKIRSIQYKNRLQVIYIEILN